MYYNAQKYREGMGILFCKETVDILGFVGQIGSVTNIQYCHCHAKGTMDNM